MHTPMLFSHIVGEQHWIQQEKRKDEREQVESRAMKVERHHTKKRQDSFQFLRPTNIVACLSLFMVRPIELANDDEIVKMELIAYPEGRRKT